MHDHASTSQRTVTWYTHRLRQVGERTMLRELGGPVLVAAGEVTHDATFSAETEIMTREAFANAMRKLDLAGAAGIRPGDVWLLKSSDDSVGATSKTIIVGRGKEAHVRVRSSLISKVHAQFERQMDGRLLVTDLRSKNGTVVNGERLTPGAPVSIESGATLRLGAQDFEFYERRAFLAKLAEGQSAQAAL